MPLPRRGRTATNRAPPGSNLNFYPVRNWRLGQHLVVIGRHTYRTLESYDWEPLDALALDLAAARGAMRLDQKEPLTLPNRTSDVTPDLKDEQTIVVSRQPLHEQMADSITVIATASSRASTPQNTTPIATSSPVPTQPDTDIDSPPPTQRGESTSIPTLTQPALQPEIPIIDHDDLSIPDSWRTALDSDEEDDHDPTEPPPLPDAKQAEYLSPHTCSWLAAEFQSMAKDRAAEQDENFRFRAEMTATTNSIREDLRSLTNDTGNALTRVIQENRVIKALLDTILRQTKTPSSPPDRLATTTASSSSGTSSSTPKGNPSPTVTSPTSSTSSASTQAVDIHPFAKCPPDNTPASGSGSEGSPPGPNNPPPPRSARPNQKRGPAGKDRGATPEDTAMKFGDPHLNKDCLPYSNGNLSHSRHAAPDAEKPTPETHRNSKDTAPITRQTLPPLADPNPPQDPFRTPVEHFLDLIDERLDNGSLTPTEAQRMRNTYQRFFSDILRDLPPGLHPHGTISPMPDPDMVIPDYNPIIDLTTPQAPAPITDLTSHPVPEVVDLITPPALAPAPTTPSTSQPPTPRSPPPEKREYSPEREELAQLCGQEVHKNKGWQAVQGASPAHNTEDSLRAIPTHAPASSGIFKTYSPDATATPARFPDNAEGALLAFGTVSPPAGTDSPISNNLTANEEPNPRDPSPFLQWHQVEDIDGNTGKTLPKKPPKAGSPFHTNAQRRKLLESKPEHSTPVHHPKTTHQAPPARRSGGNEVRLRRNGLTSRYTHTIKNTPLTGSNINSLSTKGSLSPEEEEVDHQIWEAIWAVADQLEQESREKKESQSLHRSRGVILSQETDVMRAHLINWACHGPSGPDIPQDIPLTGPQTRELNERLRAKLAYQSLPMITPIPLPPPPSSNIPPLRPPRERDSYCPITGTYDKLPGNSRTAPSEVSDWHPPARSTRGHQTPHTESKPTRPTRDDNPLFIRDISHSAELPPTYPNNNTTRSTAYVCNANTPPKGQAWKPALTRIFNNTAVEDPDPRRRIRLESVTYAPHYPNMLCLRVSHSPGLENTELLQALKSLGEKKILGEKRNNFTIARTFTDIIVTTEKGGPELSTLATTAATQITKLLDIRRANHPAKYIQDYQSEGPALRVPVLTSDLKDNRLSFPFRQGGLHVQLYQRIGDTAKYTDTRGYTVSLPRPSLSPAPPKQWAPCKFCGGQGHERPNCFKEKILRLTNDQAIRPWKTLRPPGRQGIPNPPPSISPGPTTPSCLSTSSTDSTTRAQILGYNSHKQDRRETARTYI